MRRGATALRTLPAPEQPLARLRYAGNLLREHRGDGHVVALVANGIGGTEAHVLHALSQGMPAEKFGRVSHLPHAQLAAVVDGTRDRGLTGADGWLTADGRAVKTRIEALTADLAAPAYDALQPSELAQLIADLEPIAAALNAAYDTETNRSRRNGVAAGLGGLTGWSCHLQIAATRQNTRIRQAADRASGQRGPVHNGGAARVSQSWRDSTHGDGRLSGGPVTGRGMHAARAADTVSTERGARGVGVPRSCRLEGR